MIRFLQTPGPIKKIVLGGMLLFISAAMVISLGIGGLNSSLGGPGEGVVAQVGSEQVSAQEVLRTAEQMIKRQFPRGAPQMSMLRPYFSNQALEQLITQKALLAEADRQGLRATDEEVRDELQTTYAAYFFPGGKFIGQAQYESFLNTNGLTPELFESGLKEQLVINKLRKLVTGSATVSDLEIMREFDQRNVKVKFNYAVLTGNDVMKGIHPSEAELKAFYEQNKAVYNNATPEKRKIRYVLLDTGKLAAQTQVTHDELQSYYNQHQEEYRLPEQVKVRHILIKTPIPAVDGKVDPKGVEDARKKAEDVLKQLKAGAKFEDLAKKYSEDTGSATKGGSIDWISKGRTVPEFEKAAFSLPKGGTSDLVQSSYGFHIIRVDDKQDAHLKTLDEVKGQIEPIVKQQKTAQANQSLAADLLAVSRKNGLDKAAAAKGLQVVTTDFISPTDSLPGIGSAPEFTQAVFQATEKAPPDGVQLSQGYAVFEVATIKPPATPSFDEIRSRVESEFKNQRAATLLTQKTQELSDRAKAGHDLKKAAKEVGATVKTSDFVSQDGQVPDIGPMAGSAAVAFTMQKGEISGPINAGANGVVLAILDQQQPTAQDFAAKRDEIRDSLLQNKESEMFTLFISSLRDQMQKAGKIKINQDEKKKLAGGAAGEEGE